MEHTEVEYWSKRVKHFMKLDSLLEQQEAHIKNGEYNKAKRCSTRIERHLADYESHISQKKP